jgi:hypothetical protein
LVEYFAVEASPAIRHESARIEMFALPGTSITHNGIATNLLTHVRTVLRSAGCDRRQEPTSERDRGKFRL